MNLPKPKNERAGIRLTLHEQQGRALLSPATEILFGGAAGGGKSHLLRVAAITCALEVPGVQLYLFRRSYPDLIKNHLEGPMSFHVLLADLVRSGHARIVDKEIRFWNGSKIYLNHLQHEKDIYSYQGQEIHGLFFDELTHFTETMYRYLRGRCRVVGLKIPQKWRGKLPFIMSGSNPGGVGHVWVKRTFIKWGPYRIVRTNKLGGGLLRQYIPSLHTQNPYLMRDDPDYESRLFGLGDRTLVRAMLEGDWNIVSGSMFGDAWSETRHLCDPFPIPADWRIWRGGDDGFASPAAIYWLTKDPKTGTIYVIREIYKRGMRPEPMAAMVKARDQSIRRIDHDGTEAPNGRILSGVLDNAAFADTGTQEAIPRGNAMNALGCRWEPAEKWPGSRVARVQHLHRLLAPNPKCPRGLPGIRFFRGLTPYAVETIPTLPRDPKDPEDVDTDAEDHAFDAITYGLLWRSGGAGRAKVVGK